MFRTILVPLDGSRFAEAALPAVRAVARRARCRIRLILAHESGLGIVPAPEAGLPLATLAMELRGDQEHYLAAVAERLARELKRDVQARVVIGPAGGVIAREAKRVKADLVIMATHGSGVLGRVGLGSVADHVIRHLHLPVLLIRPPAEKARPGRLRLNRILVPVDFSAPSAAALAPLRRWLRMMGGGRITLLHINQPAYQVAFPTQPYPLAQNAALFEIHLSQGRRLLRELAGRIRGRGVTVTTRLASGAGVSATILDVLKERRHDMAVISTHGRSGLRRLLLGSVADKVVRHATKPVLVYRPAASRKRAVSRKRAPARARKVK